MDFDLRDWLLIIGPLFIIAILLHGYWRMRVNNSKLKMSLDKSFMSSPSDRPSEEEDIDMLRAELPNGGARVRTVPEQTKLDLDDEVPVLLEPVDGYDHGFDDNGPAISASRDGFPSPDDTEETAPATTGAVDEQAIDSADSEERAGVEDAPPPQGLPEFYVVLYVTALDAPFDGQVLLECLIEQDMQFGEMDIFHRHDSRGEPRFSLVNAVEPGTFDPGAMDALRTPAVSLFMRAHEQSDPVGVYDEMTDVARALALELGGEVKDESRSVLTPQTMEHCREKIRDYRLKYA